MDHFHTFCQLVGLARINGWTMVALPQAIGAGCQHLLGLHQAENRHHLVGVWFDNAAATDRQYEALPTLPFAGHEAVLVAPLAGEKFAPDIILIHGTPAQMHLLLCAFIYHDFERLKFYFTGEGSCADTLAEAYHSRKPALSIPCFGQRRYGHIREDELEMAMPPDWLGKGLAGLRSLSANGIRYPIPHWGMETDPSPGLGVSYPQFRK